MDIIKPLGLRNTSYVHPDVRSAGLHVRGYLHPDEAGAPLVDSTEQTVSWAQSAGAIISSPADLNTFVTALMRGRLLTPRMLEEMTTVTPTDATNTRFYGLGGTLEAAFCGKKPTTTASASAQPRSSMVPAESDLPERH